MKHLQLQPRLRLLADMVPAGAHLADIGTDHGYLPVWLMQQGRIASAIAADIGPEPLAHARRTAEGYGAALDLRLCDGLRGIAPHETDTVVIAGMGGETIIHILTDSPWPRTSRRTLLCPRPRWSCCAAGFPGTAMPAKTSGWCGTRGSSMWCCR